MPLQRCTQNERLRMKAYVNSAGVCIENMGVGVVTLFDGPEICFTGQSEGKSARVYIQMNNYQAIELAIRLVESVNKHAQTSYRHVEQFRKKLNRKGPAK